MITAHLLLWTAVVGVLAALLVIPGGVDAALGESCDWIGSGSSSSAARGVTPIYLRCQQGQIEWRKPKGALRVSLQLGTTDFRACVRVASNFRGARLFLEAPRALVPLFAPGQTNARRALCFRSRGGRAALYVEAGEAGPDPANAPVASFSYDLQPHPEPLDECRPCSTDEAVRAFCTSDVVSRGIIKGIYNNEDLDVSEVTVGVTKLLRQNTPVSDPFSTNSVEDSNGSSPVPHDNIQSARTKDEYESSRELMFQAPYRCGVKLGEGEFVFIARRRLGDLSLTCAPRLEDWIKLVWKVNADGSSPCILES